MSLDLQKIGLLLRETRETKGLKLEDVSGVLYLRKSILDALERGDWDKLPHQVYVKGYLNQYASYLCIEDKLAEATRSSIESDELPVPVSRKEKDSLRHENHASERLRGRHPNRRFIVYGAGFAVLVVFFIYQSLNRPYSLLMPSGTYKVSHTAYDTAAKSSERPVVPALELKKLVIGCQERTWIRIVIDGTEKKEFMLNPEEMVAFNAKEGFDLLIGNAGGVTLFYNGKNVGLEGENGEVKRVKLP